MSSFKIYFQSLILVFFAINISIAQDIPGSPESSFSVQTSQGQSNQQGLDNVEGSEGSVNPSEYFVGPGDMMFISISGIKEFVYKLNINPEGWMYIPQVGGVDLKNKTLAGAKIELEESIRRFYKDVDVFIALIGFKKIRVSLNGNVNKSANYILFGNSRLMDLITISEGLSETADIRNIKIISREDSVNIYDFLEFLRFGKKENNPLLREGDIVLVDKSDKSVKISGEVKYPGIYEFVENESVYDLIQFAGGFLTKALTDTIEVIRFDENGEYQTSEFYSLELLKENELILHNKDHVIVRAKPEYLIELFVKVDGYVRYPGFYRIDENKTTLSQIISEAGGLLDNGSYTEATLTRTLNVSTSDPEFERLKIIPRIDMTDDEYAYFKAKSRQRAGRVVVNFYDLLLNGNKTEDVTLYRGDLIQVPEKKNYVTLLGQVINPGNIEYYPDYNVQNYINIAGGFGWRALEGDVRVIKALTGEWVDADDVKSLEPGDTIWVPEDPPPPKFWDVFMDALTITAQLAVIVVAITGLVVASR